MPHVLLEYSRDLEPVPDLNALFAAIHSVLADVAGAPVGNSKSRARAVEAHIADGDGAHAMVHLEIRLMEGRTSEQKSEVSRICLRLLVDAFAPAAVGRQMQTTVEVRDIDRATYAKHPEGTIA